MPLVRVRLLHGTRLVGAPVRPFASDATLQTVLAKVLEAHPGAAVQSLEAFPDANEKPTSRSEFQPEDFGKITVGELAEQSLGLFWVAHVLYATKVPMPSDTSADARPATEPSTALR